MPFRNAIFVTLFSVSYVTGISGTIYGHAEHEVYSLAYVAHHLRFELAIRSSNPGWYCEEMQLFAYKLNGARWNKRDITWGIEGHSKTISRSTVVEAARKAFKSWSEYSSLNFEGPVQQPDIMIKFVPSLNGKLLSKTVFGGGDRTGDRAGDVLILDSIGARIMISDLVKWCIPYGSYINWITLRSDENNISYVLTHEIGHSLGLATWNIGECAMKVSANLLGANSYIFPNKDDVEGIQKLYGPPSARKPWGAREPQSSGLPQSCNKREPRSSSIPQPSSSSSSQSSSSSSLQSSSSSSS